MSLAGLAQALRAGELSPREAVETYLARIDALDGDVNAYITVRAEEALREAVAAERTEARGPLWGVPIALKDVIDVAGTPTTAGSKVLERNVPTEDAHVVTRLREAGAIVLGKLNTHEFAYGATTTSRHFGPCRNPWSRDRICGGSSGGSGAAIAAELAPATLGTDTAGSIRIPSAFCGATGVRPSTGRVSNRGVVPVAKSFDVVGPIAATAADCALVLAAVAGHDPEDPQSLDRQVPPYHERLEEDVDGLRVGVVSSLMERADPHVAERVSEALDELRSLGFGLRAASRALLEHAGTIQQAMQFREATGAHLDSLRTHLVDYGDDVRARLLVGLFLPSELYESGRKARALAREELRRLFENFDLLAAPAMPILPPRIGEDTVDVGGEEILYRLALIPYNSPWSLAGVPVAVVPCGLVEGLPVGLALIGPPFGEEVVLRAAHVFQRATDWHELRPSLPMYSAALGALP
jgi:aspartyl-tRNA(Asn)/glutamyl-tRNA(Gln) amidotransferase subunit A